MSALKDQLGAIITYLSRRGTTRTMQAQPKQQITSVSTLVAKLLDDWKKMPESERKVYEDIHLEGGLKNSQTR